MLYNVQETYFRFKDPNSLNETWKKVFHVNSNRKRAGVPTLISDKIDFITKQNKLFLGIKRDI